VIPRLIKKAWSSITPARVVAAFADCGLVIGNTEALRIMRQDFQSLLLARAPDASCTLQAFHGKKRTKTKSKKTAKGKSEPRERHQFRPHAYVYARTILRLDNLTAGLSADTVAPEEGLSLYFPGGILTGAEAIDKAKKQAIKAQEKKESQAEKKESTTQRIRDRWLEGIEQFRINIQFAFSVAHRHANCKVQELAAIERDVWSLFEYNKTLNSKFTDAMLVGWTLKHQVARQIEDARSQVIAKMAQYTGPGLKYPIQMTREVNAWKKNQRTPEAKASE
jgi:hypothetical protein